MQDKIVSLGALKHAVKLARSAGKTIVQCHGFFDIVHPGHVRYLQFARRQGDILIVSIAGDTDTNASAWQTYIPQHLRAENLAALMFVDYVCIDCDQSAERILSSVQPDLYVKGSEYEHSIDHSFLAEKAVVEGYGGRIIFSSGEIVLATTEWQNSIVGTDGLKSHHLGAFTGRHDLSLDTLKNLLKQFRDLHVLIVGDTLLDRYVICDAPGIASESPMLSLVQRDCRTFVGGAAIVARHVAALGAHAFLLSAGGNDDTTKLAKDVLTDENVESLFMESRPSIAEKTRFVADQTKLFKVDAGQILPLDSQAERRAACILEQQCKVADAVIFCDFGYGMITGGLLSRVLPTLRHNVRLLTADVSGGRANLLNFQNVDLLCPTERELRATLNDHDSGLSAAAWELLNRTNARHLFVTLEQRGLVSFERQCQDRNTGEWSGRLKSEQLPALANHSVDRLGCGDAMLAAATLSLTADGTLMQAAYLGSATAAIEVSLLGNHPIPSTRLLDWLRARPELLAGKTRHPQIPVTA